MRPSALSIAALAACIGSGNLAFAKPGPAAREPPFALSISTEKPSYGTGDEIGLKLTFDNHGPRPITLVHPEYWGVTDIQVRDGEGRKVEPARFKSERTAFPQLLTLPPGELTSYVFDRLRAWTCCNCYTFELRKPGRYKLTVRITNPPVQSEPPGKWKPDWTGTATSNTVTVEVRD